MTVDSGTLGVIAGVAGTYTASLLGGLWAILRDNRKRTEKHNEVMLAKVSETVDTNFRVSKGTVELLEKQVSILTENQDKSIADRNNLQKQLDEFRQQQQEREKASAENSKQIAALKNDLTAAKYQIEELTDQLRDEKAKNVDLVNAQASFVIAQAKIADLEKQYKAVMDERDSLKSEIGSLKSRLSDVEIKLGQTMKTNAELEAEGQRKDSVIASLQQENDRLTARNDELEQRVKVLEAQINIKPTPADAPLTIPPMEGSKP